MRATTSLPTRLAQAAAVLLAAALVALACTVPAWAHNQLLTASPARHAVLTDPPTQVDLEFAQALNPDFTTIVITGADARRIATDAPQVSGTRSTVRITEQLSGGTYTVAYRVVSADGHTVQGAYPFTVTGAQSGPSGATTQSAAPPAAPKSAGISAVVAPAALLLLAIGFGYLWWRRRPSRPDPQR